MVDSDRDETYRGIPTGTSTTCEGCGGPARWDGSSWACSAAVPCDAV